MNEPETVIARIREEIALLNIVTLSEEGTDTGEVWEMLNSFSRMCGGPDLLFTSAPDLDELVYEMKANEASGINNEGVRGQLQYLQEAMHPAEFLALIEGRMPPPHVKDPCQ